MGDGDNVRAELDRLWPKLAPYDPLARFVREPATVGELLTWDFERNCPAAEARPVPRSGTATLVELDAVNWDVRRLLGRNTLTWDPHGGCARRAGVALAQLPAVDARRAAWAPVATVGDSLEFCAEFLRECVRLLRTAGREGEAALNQALAPTWTAWSLRLVRAADREFKRRSGGWGLDACWYWHLEDDPTQLGTGFLYPIWELEGEEEYGSGPLLEFLERLRLGMRNDQEPMSFPEGIADLIDHWDPPATAPRHTRVQLNWTLDHLVASGRAVVLGPRWRRAVEFLRTYGGSVFVYDGSEAEADAIDWGGLAGLADEMTHVRRMKAATWPLIRECRANCDAFWMDFITRIDRYAQKNPHTTGRPATIDRPDPAGQAAGVRVGV